MKVTFSESADMILSRHSDFRDKLLAVLEGNLAGHCFVDGRVGKNPSDDELVLRSQGHPAINIAYHEFADVSTVRRIAEEWSTPGPK